MRTSLPLRHPVCYQMKEAFSGYSSEAVDKALG